MNSRNVLYVLKSCFFVPSGYPTSKPTPVPSPRRAALRHPGPQHRCLATPWTCHDHGSATSWSGSPCAGAEINMQSGYYVARKKKYNEIVHQDIFWH